jgi:redox-sensitive bicupin YhaK (pirin superfamily)
MIHLRPAHERGHANHGWLDSFHTFSFANYYDPRYMGVSHLRVINDDTVAPSAGFDTHAHTNMEIISYVLSGALEHKDSMGHGSIIRPGEVQRMSAGKGIRHSEFNASHNEVVNFLQIWIVPNVSGIQPGYEQKNFAAELPGRLCLVASPDGREGSLTIHQDAWVYAGKPENDQTLQHSLATARTAYVHVARGQLELNGTLIQAGDGASISDEPVINLTGKGQAEVLLFDLP